MHRRGVRRIFAAFVKGTQRVCEWEPKSQSWHLLDRGAAIADVILIRPLPVVALLDAAEADNAAVEALRAKNHPKLQEIHREGRREALQEVLLDLLKEKFGGLEEGVQERIAQADPALLKKWIVRAATATRLGDVVGLS
jgi:rhamnose utilization protein RhaD (predicted bifunctional aldolase and dehydrogenase)